MFPVYEKTLHGTPKRQRVEDCENRNVRRDICGARTADCYVIINALVLDFRDLYVQNDGSLLVSLSPSL
jgi:hypothetical protein